MALNEAKGLEASTDGILGLAVNRDDDMKDASFLRQMKTGRAISNEIISFSLSPDNGAYAILGGVNPQQIVGGDTSLVFFPRSRNEQTWALDASGVIYGDDKINESSMPAVIDTGSS